MCQPDRTKLFTLVFYTGPGGKVTYSKESEYDDTCFYVFMFAFSLKHYDYLLHDPTRRHFTKVGLDIPISNFNQLEFWAAPQLSF